MSSRFSSPELLNLGPPPDLASRPYETLLIETKAKIVVDMAVIGIDYDVSNLETDPVIVVAQSAVYRDLLRRREIDGAVAQTYLGSATGAFLDRRAADYGVLRRSLPHTLVEPAPVARPTTVPPAWTWDAVATLWKEDDTSLRTRARLSWEALSVAGPAGAYAFHAADAHPAVDGEGTVVIGPETDLVEPGEVLLVVQSNLGNGVPSRAVLDTVAARLDAYRVTDGFGASTIRTVRDNQSVRPLGAKVLIEACRPVSFNIDATLYLRAGPDPEPIRQTALARLSAHLAQRRKIGARVSREALIAVLGVADANGLPIVEDVELTYPAADIAPAYNELATVGPISVQIVLR